MSRRWMRPRVKVTVRAGLPVVGATYAMTYTVHGDGDDSGGMQL